MQWLPSGAPKLEEKKINNPEIPISSAARNKEADAGLPMSCSVVFSIDQAKIQIVFSNTSASHFFPNLYKRQNYSSVAITKHVRHFLKFDGFGWEIAKTELNHVHRGLTFSSLLLGFRF